MTEPTVKRMVNAGFVLPMVFSVFAAVSILHAQAIPKKITAGVTSLSGSTAVIFVTQKAGLFKRHGLDAEIVYLQSVPLTASALISRDIQVALMSGSGTLSVAIGGLDVVQVAGLVNKLYSGVMVAPSIKSLQDLKGSSIGIAGLGGQSEFAANYALRKGGLVPHKDVALLSIGGNAERVAALATGKVKAVIVTPPFTGQMEKMGFRKLVNFPALDLEFQTMGIAVIRHYLKTNRDTVMSFLKAITEGIYFYKTHKEETKKIMASSLRMEDQDALEETYSLFVQYLYPEVPHSSLRSLQNALDAMALRNTKARDKNPADVIENSLVKEMEESGFIAQIRNKYGAPGK
ncbi:MAG: ABC transporter substrate-binding protein [Deltaproteobacteria bacterium]|nr:ABC transporter substrate-binding protein [Deltaproteobacteria bacterium]